VAFGWTPPSNSPLFLNLHPRLWFISDAYRGSNPDAPGMTVGEMRTKLTKHYSTEFQAFINAMDAPDVYGGNISSKDKMYLTNDGINYAFLYMMDPANMEGFSSTYTRTQYAQKAKDHWTQLAKNVKDEAASASQGSSWNDTRELYSNDDTHGGPVNLSLAAIYDWLGGVNGSYFDAGDVDVLLDAMDKAYTNSWSEYNTSGKTPYLNNVATGMMHNAFYIALALYGDTIDTALTARKDQLENVFLKGLRDLGNHVHNDSANWVEGIGLYYFESAVHLIYLYGGLSSAIGEDLFNTTKFLYDAPNFIFYNVMPTPVSDGDKHWQHFDDDDPANSIRTPWTTRSYYALSGLLEDTNPDGSSLLKWLWEDSGWSGSSGIYTLDPRKDYVFFNFFSGMNQVVSRSPSTIGMNLSAKMGEEFCFKSDLESDDSALITFWAQEYHVPLSHAHFDFASFLIHKYGDLAIQRSIRKGYSGGNIGATNRSMFYNTIGVYKPDEVHHDDSNLMCYKDRGYNEDYLYATDSSYQLDGTNYVGSRIEYDLEGTDYDYVDYDYSKAWDNTKVDYSEREFVYLRSEGGMDDEYVVVFDRINSIEPFYTKYFLLHASNEPKLLSNDGREIAMTPEPYPNDSDDPGGRWVNTSSKPTADNTIQITSTYDGTHGRLYSRTLLPSSFQINKVGGPGHYWEDAEGRLIHTKTLSDEEKYFRGTYTMQVQSTSNLKYDIFLNVMQFGDSNTLTQMSQVDKITATGSNGNMVGALIKDSTKNRVVLFNESKRATVDKVEAEISYTVTTTTASSYHLLTNIKTNQAYGITRSGTEIGRITSSDAGTLAFSDSVSPGPYTYSITEDSSPSVGDTEDPTVEISSPGDTAHDNGSDPTADLSGTASDNVGVTSVTWNSDVGDNGTASGTTSWSISDIALVDGNNIITVAAHDAKGNTSTDTIVIVYTAVTGEGNTYYIDQTGGSDSSDGASPTRAWKTLSNVNGKAFAPGDTILLQRGKSWDDALTISADGTASSPITIGAYGTGDDPVIEGLTIDEGDYIVVEDITVDGKKSDSDAVRVRGSQGSVLRRLTIRNGTKDGLDIARAVDLLVDSCLIHHFLAGSYAVQQDAHGIVVGESQQITIRNTEVHHVSGDSLQADQDRNPENLTNNILIEDSHFWTGPLTEDFNEGWLRGQNPGENAIDTKVLKSGWESVPRMSITIRNLVAHGWEKDDFVENRAVFNLKEKIEAVLDGISVYDSEIGFRVRGTRGNANVTIKNAVIYSCERAIRAEDDLENLKVYNSTFGDSIDTQLQFAGGSGGTGSWDFRNNAFVDRKPNIASEQSNVVILDGELSSNFVDTGSGDYRLNTGSSLIETGETLANVTTDRDGKIRTPAYDVGAYEFSTDSDPSGTPASPMGLRIIR